MVSLKGYITVKSLLAFLSTIVCHLFLIVCLCIHCYFANKHFYNVYRSGMLCLYKELPQAKHLNRTSHPSSIPQHCEWTELYALILDTQKQ